MDIYSIEKNNILKYDVDDITSFMDKVLHFSNLKTSNGLEDLKGLMVFKLSSVEEKISNLTSSPLDKLRKNRLFKNAGILKSNINSINSKINSKYSKEVQIAKTPQELTRNIIPNERKTPDTTLADINETNKSIFLKLKEIEENMIDEQDTNIKKVSEIQPEANIIKTSEMQISNPDMNGGIFGLAQTAATAVIAGLLGAAGFGFLKMLGQFGLKAVETLFNIAVKGISAVPMFFETLATTVKGIFDTVTKFISRSLEPIMDLVSKVAKYVGFDLDISKPEDKKVSERNKIKNKTNTKKGTTGAIVVDAIDNKSAKEATMVSEALGKSASKKIPILGAAAGAAFAYDRFSNDDISGGVLEVLSGIAGIFPVAGTAISGAIDTYLLMSDIEERNNENRSSRVNVSYLQNNNDISLVERIKQNEDFKPYLYPDAHGMSIGYGHFAEGDGSTPVEAILGYNPGNVITKEEAEILLQYDISRAKDQLIRTFPWVSNQPKEVQDNLIDMTFNLGIGGISGFKRALNYIQNEDYSSAANELADSDWYSQVGDRAKRIVGDFHKLGGMSKDDIKVLKLTSNYDGTESHEAKFKGDNISTGKSLAQQLNEKNLGNKKETSVNSINNITNINTQNVNGSNNITNVTNVTNSTNINSSTEPIKDSIMSLFRN